MHNRAERPRPQLLSEQVKAGLSITARTLASFGVEDASVNQTGRIRFVEGQEVLDIEKKTFERENSILGMFGDDSQALSEVVYRPSLYNTEDGNTVLIRDSSFAALVDRNGYNIKDRELVSDKEGALFELVTSSQLGINAKTVEATDGGAVIDICIDDFNKFLEEFIRGNPETARVETLPQRFQEILDSKRAQGLSVRVKGLCVSICAGEESLFTVKYTFDQAVRFLIANRMYGKFDSLMSQKYPWFTSPEARKAGIILEPEMKEEIDSLVESLDVLDTNKLIQTYLSGELGLKYLDLIVRQKNEEEAEKLKLNMLGAKDDFMPDYSGYEVNEETQEVEEFLEMEEAEPISVPSFRKKGNKIKKMRN